MTQKNIQLFLAFLEILFPFIGYWFWGWNIIETSFALLIEIIMSITFFMFKCYYHIVQKQVLLYYYKTGRTVKLYLVRVPAALVYIAMVTVVYFLVFGVYSLLALDGLAKSMATGYMSYLEAGWKDIPHYIGENAWTYIWLGFVVSALLKLVEFIRYGRQNIYNTDRFIGIMPPEYMNTRHIKILAVGGLVLAGAIVGLISSRIYVSAIIYVIALMHLFFTLVKIYFPLHAVKGRI